MIRTGIQISSILKLSVAVLLIFNCYLKAQIFTPNDSVICYAKFKLALDKNFENEPIGDVIASIGKSFIGTDYIAHSLERTGD